MAFITGKHVARRTVLRGLAPRSRCRSSTRWCRRAGCGRRRPRPRRSIARGWSASRWCTAPPAAALGRDARTCGRRRRRARVRSVAERAQSARAVPQVPDDRQRHRRARRRGGHAARDRRRPFPIERRVPHAGASEADRELGRARRRSRWIRSTPSGSGRTRRFRRCSCASRTSIRRAAARTATRASTPT